MRLRLAFLAVLLGAFTAHGQVFGRWNKNDEGSGKTKNPILLSLSLLPPDSECSGTPPDGVTFTRASAATCIDSSGVAHALATNEARVHSTLGLLVEGSATNAVLHSRDVTAASWIGTGCAKTGTGMDGFTSVGRCTGATSAIQMLTVAAGARTASAYVRRQSGTCNVQLKADTETTSKSLLGGWERLVLTYTSDGDVTLEVSVSSGCVADIDYVQDEAGSVATSPIATGGTAAVRAVDTAYTDTPDASATEGCVAVEFAPLWSGPALDVSRTYLSFGNLNNRLGYTNLGAGAENWSAYGGVGNGPVHATAEWVAGVPDSYRTEWSASAGELRVFAVSSATASFSELFSPVTSIQIGGQGGSARSFGHLRNLVLGRTPEACQ